MAETCKQLSEMMKSVGFVLRKWALNYKTVFIHIPEKLWKTSAELELNHLEAIKTMRLLWLPQRDEILGPCFARSSRRVQKDCRRRDAPTLSLQKSQQPGAEITVLTSNSYNSW